MSRNKKKVTDFTERAKETFKILKEDELANHKSFVKSFKSLSRFMNRYDVINEGRFIKFNQLVDAVLEEIEANEKAEKEGEE